MRIKLEPGEWVVAVCPWQSQYASGADFVIAKKGDFKWEYRQENIFINDETSAADVALWKMMLEAQRMFIPQISR